MGSIPQGLEPLSSNTALRSEAKASGFLDTARALRAGAPWLTNTVLCVLGLGLILLTREEVWEYAGYGHYVIGGSGCSGLSVWLYVASVIVVMTQPVNRATLWIVLGFAVALRMVMLFEEPFSSSDIYRYVWDGIVQHAHISPYRYVPGNPALAFLRDPSSPTFDVWNNINRRDYAVTIYPPVAQMVYWLVTFLSPTVNGMKAAMFGFECLTVATLLTMLKMMKRPLEQILLYAWCPLLVWEIALGGHVDAAVFAFITLALLFRYREQSVLTGLFLGLAVMTKFYPLVLVPALYKRGDWKMPATLVAVIVGSYVPYLSAGKLVFGFLGGYAQEEGMNTGTRYYALDLVHHLPGLSQAPKGLFFGFCAVVFGALMWWCWKNCSREGDAFLRGAMMLAMAMMLLFSPHYPWYIAWLIPFFTLVPNLPLLTYVCAFFYGFTTALADGGLETTFRLNSWIYGALAVAVVITLVMRLPLMKPLKVVWGGQAGM
jgi:alpha-1,6-mannosyltransferase